MAAARIDMCCSRSIRRRSETSNERLRPDRDYGLSWIKRVGKGRVFYTALGHTPTLFATPALAEHVLAGIQFALGDLEADATPQRETPAVIVSFLARSRG